MPSEFHPDDTTAQALASVRPPFNEATNSNPSWGAGLTTSAGAAALLSACGGGGSSSTATPPILPPTVGSAGLTMAQSARFLSQAAVGHTHDDILSIYNNGINAWLSSQFSMSRPSTFWDFLVSHGYAASTNMNTQNGFNEMIWSQLITSADILRQRVGLALFNQWVVSVDGLNLNWQSFAMAGYMDVLWNHAFGNYRDLMEAVSTNVAMGSYLTFLNSVKADPSSGAIPDENYARELMQLFTIGLYQLNLDGSLKLSGGNPVPTYTQNDVSQLARVWTGYTYDFWNTNVPDGSKLPMSVNEGNHETGASSFLGTSIPAGTNTAGSRKIALDALFNHPNVGPFVGRQLIQHLVTSNPSAAYVQRVAQKFNDNGLGVRGDMKAVIQAILTDDEARNDANLSSNTFGRLKEPVMRLVHWARVCKVQAQKNDLSYGDTSSATWGLAQGEGHSPSVFNWFRPGYTPPGTSIATQGLVAPEMQIENEISVIQYVNFMQNAIINPQANAMPDYTDWLALAADSLNLVNELNLVLAAGQINALTLNQIKTAVASVAAPLERVRIAFLLVMASPDYLLQH